MRLLTLALAGAALAGCAMTDATVQRSQAVRAAFEQQLAAWNAAGVDPLQLAPQQQIYATIACGALSSIGSVIDPDAPTLTGEIAAWCADAVRAASPAAPMVAPMPEPKPAN